MVWSSVIQSVSISTVIGGIIGGMIGYFVRGYLINKWQRIPELLIEMEKPVEGHYIGEFHEKIGGETQTKKADTIIEQHGKDLAGEFELKDQDNNRISEIDGKIFGDDIHVFGSYEAKKYDEHKGIFFCHIESEDKFSGYWAGYTHEKGQNAEISGSGKYNLRSTINISVKKPENKHANEIVKLSEDLLPSYPITEFLTTDQTEKREGLLPLDESISVNRSFIRIAIPTESQSVAIKTLDRIRKSDPTNVVAKKIPTVEDQTIDESMLGFILCSVVSSNNLDELPVDESKIPEPLRHGSQFGVINIVCVKEKYQNRGIATQLINECIKNFRDKEVNTCFLVIKSTNSNKSIFYKEGFDLIAEDVPISVQSNSWGEYYGNQSTLSILAKSINGTEPVE
jgi:ribosomal protein S18 acetylase RimI-like enzyme